MLSRGFVALFQLYLSRVQGTVQLICLVCFTLAVPSFKDCARALSLSLKHLQDNLYHTVYWTNS